MGDDQIWSIQTRSLAFLSQRSRPRGWVRVDYFPPHTGRVRQVVTLYAFDCVDQRFAVLHRISRTASGDVIENVDYAETEGAFEHVVPTPIWRW